MDSFLLSLHHKGFVNYHIPDGKAALKPEAAASILLCGDGVITCYGVIWTLQTLLFEASLAVGCEL